MFHSNGSLRGKLSSASVLFSVYAAAAMCIFESQPKILLCDVFFITASSH